ncbi:MAG: TIGR01777 family protein [Euryarchaeota archaeon]|nr:TIGR01777 family protein [Euryarchaeota archaeon]
MEFTHSTQVETSVEQTFDWHERKGAFRRLMPPWEQAELVSGESSLEDGTRLTFKFPMGPLKMKWIAEHSGYNPPHAFADTMIKGPFKTWHHVHSFVETENNTCRVDDRVEYTLPMGILGRIFGSGNVRKRLDRMFKAREIRLAKDLKRYHNFAHIKRKKILIAGSSGLIGRQLVAFFGTSGHDVWRLVRRAPQENEVQWNPSEGKINSDEIEGFDAVIHLGGAGIGDKRWTKKRKIVLEESRTKSTQLLSTTIAKLKNKPEVFIISSAMGYYGSRGDENLTEDSSAGSGFLPDMCVAWEASAQAAKDAGVRTIHCRTGLVLDATGGVLKKMLLPAQVGAGGPIGWGKQWYSWISMDDQVYAIDHLMMTKECSGAYNFGSPNPVRQKMFAKVLGKILRRPSFMPVPPFGIWFLMGKMGVTLATDSSKMLPNRLVESGYEFQHTDLESSLRDALGKWKK